MAPCSNFLPWRIVPKNAALLLVLIGLSSSTALAQQFNGTGPYTTDSYMKSVELTVSSSVKKLGVTLTYPLSDNGPFPLVLMFNGFQCKASWYVDTVTHVASWGYAVLQYDLSFIAQFAGDREEASYLQPLLDWLSGEVGPGSSSAAAGQVDLSRKAVLGHSRGGKMAALHYATRDDIETAVLLDPVDCFITGPNYPSAVAALGGMQLDCGQPVPPLTRSDKMAAVIGAGHVAPIPCNPPKYNYAKFAGVLGPGTWQILIPQAGHMQFPESSDLAYRALALTCGKGDIQTAVVVEDARTIAVAWLESVFRETQSEQRMLAFGDWLEEQEASGTLTFETLVSQRSGKPRLSALTAEE